MAINKQTKKISGRNTKRTIKTYRSSEGERVTWQFDKLDKNGKFAFDLDREDFEHREFLEKMINYSNMTWAEVDRQTHDQNKSKHHYLQFNALSCEARKRFQVMDLDEESDNIFSFAFNNRLRIIGIRREGIFYVLWYDPRHEVCVSKKK